MNSKLLRGCLNGTGISLPIWGLVLSFFVAWWWIPVILGAALIIVAGALEWVEQDCGYTETVYGGDR